MKSIKKIAIALVVTFAFSSNVSATEINMLSNFYGWFTSLTTGEKPDPSAPSCEESTTGEKPDPN